MYGMFPFLSYYLALFYLKYHQQSNSEASKPIIIVTLINLISVISKKELTWYSFCPSLKF